MSERKQSPSASTADDAWTTLVPHRKSNISVCRNLSHLIHRLHGATEHTSKFVLSTHYRQFESQFHGSKVASTRLIMAMDPDFLALLLRSSPVIASYTLRLLPSLICEYETAAHLSTLLPHVSSLLLSLNSDSGLEPDPTTAAMLERSGSNVDIMRARMSLDCLSFFVMLEKHLGRDAINNTDLDVVDMSESVDDLNREMFDLAIDPSLKDNGKTTNAGKATPETMQKECHLCLLIEHKDYKEESIQLEQVYRDLDTLAAAHLEDIRMQNTEDKDLRDDTNVTLPAVLLKAGRSALAFLSEKANEESPKELVETHLSSLKVILGLMKESQFLALLEECICSKDFDVIRILFELAMSETGNFADETVKTRLTNTAVRLLDTNLHKMSTEVVNSFLIHMMNCYGLQALSRISPQKDLQDLLQSIGSVMRRVEIEIHMALDDFFRHGKVAESVASSFMLLEVMLTCLADNEMVLPSCSLLFSAMHRIMTTIFDFFDEIDKSNIERGNQLITCCSRLVGCFMTLEPLYLKNQYLSKLPKILSVVSSSDVRWLLPSLEYIEVIDLEGVTTDLLQPLLSALTLEITSLKQESKTEASMETISMLCRLLNRFIVGMMGNGIDMFTSIKATGNITVPQFRGFYCSSTLDGNVHFSPRMPIGMAILPAFEISTASGVMTNLRYAVGIVQSLFIEVLYREHPKLRECKQARDIIDLKHIHDVLMDSIASLSSLKADWSVFLSQVSLLAASFCLSRLHQSVLRELMEPSISYIIMECLAISLAYASPERITRSTDWEGALVELWCSIVPACTLVMERQPCFINVMAMVFRKLKLRPPIVKQDAIQGAVDDGWITEDCSVAIDFMCALVSSILGSSG